MTLVWIAVYYELQQELIKMTEKHKMLAKKKDDEENKSLYYVVTHKFSMYYLQTLTDKNKSYKNQNSY